MKQKLFFLCFALVYSANILAHDFEVDGIYYNILSDSTVAVTYQGNSYSAYADEYIGTVTIPAVVIYNETTYYVTSINSSAFCNCTSLKSIVLPESLTTIGSYAFYNSGLTSVTIPNNVTEVGGYVFSKCSNLTTAKWNAINCNNIGYEVFGNWYDSDCPITTFTFGDSVEVIPARLCMYMKHLTTITIPENVTNIGENVFYGCSKLINVTWNAKNYSVPDIYVNRYSIFQIADYYCPINSFTFGNQVEVIPAYLCQEMSQLTTITIPNSVTTIGNYAFKGCNNLTSLIIGKNVTVIGSSAFEGCSQLTSIVLGENATTIGSSAFKDCYNLTAVTLSNSITTIESEAFRNCSKITNITIPSSVTRVDEATFSGCSNLTSVTWNAKHCRDFYESSYTPFSGTYNSTMGSDIHSQITSFIFGDSVQHIPAYICYGMENLATLTIPNENVTIGIHAFTGCPEKFYNRFDNAKYLAVGKNKYHTLISAKEATITSCVINPKTVNIGAGAFANCNQLIEIEIPASVTTLHKGAFHNCSGLTSMNYTGDVASWCAIEFADEYSNPIYYSNNFYINDVEIQNLVIPNGVTTISDYTFPNCKRLTFVTIPNSVFTIGEGAFYDCDGLTSITIPSSVKTIGEKAFYGCNFSYLLFPETLESIGESAFANNSKLSAIKLNSLTPPECDYSFENIDKEIPIYVPCGSLDAYWNSSWSEELNNIVESDFLFMAQSEDKNKGEVIVMLNPTCDEPMAMMRVEPKEGYKFVAWNDGNTETMRTVKVTEDVIYTAYFAVTDGSDVSTEQDSVNVEVTANTAGFTWQPNEKAYLYSMSIFVDAEMTDTVCKLTFDANGNMVSRETVGTQSSPRRKMQQEVSTLNFVITDLEENTTYTYMLRSYDCNNMIIETEIGTFRTSISDTSISDVISETTDSIRKVLENGTIYILRNGEKYTVQGVHVQ